MDTRARRETIADPLQHGKGHAEDAGGVDRALTSALLEKAMDQ
jgi:hypothetical protein